MSSDEGPVAVRMPLNGSKIKQLHKCPRCERTFPFIGHLKCHFYRVHPEFRLDSNELLNIKQIMPKPDPEEAVDEPPPAKKALIVSNKPSAFSTQFALASSATPEVEEACDSPEPFDQLLAVSEPEGIFKNEAAIEAEAVSKTFKCKDCLKIFTNRTTYTKHCMVAHANVSYFMCSHCEKSFPTSQRLVAHQKAHENNKLPCLECAAHPSRNPGRCTHNKLRICEMCSHKCKTFNYWKYHQSICTGMKEETVVAEKTKKPRFECKICGKNFVSNAFLKSHIKAHGKKEAYICGDCNIGFHDEDELKDHLKTHQKVHKSDIYICGDCNENFTDEEELQVHSLVHKADPFSCSKCSMTFKRKNHLIRHEQGHN